MCDEPIGILIPCRNAPEVLWLTLTHLWAWGRGGVERVLLLDNRSTAEGSDAVLTFAAQLGCGVLRHESDVGVWCSVNRGIAALRTRWVMVLTSDVLLGPSAPRKLQVAALQADAPMVGPSVRTGMQMAPELARGEDRLEVDPSTYNGACWLMDWPRLEREVGWFDPRFYVAYGDTDYVERARKAGVPFGVVNGVPCVHLDKQTRRHDWTAEQDSEVELRDAARFHEKWAGEPDVLARHPHLSRQSLVASKRGWKEVVPS